MNISERNNKNGRDYFPNPKNSTYCFLTIIECLWDYFSFCHVFISSPLA